MDKVNNHLLKYFLSALLILIFVGAEAQYFSKELLGGKEKIEIPFEYKQGFIIVDIRFHRSFPLKFVFDTGAEHTLLLKKVYTDILNIPYHRRIQVIGSDMDRVINGMVSRDVYIGIKNAKVVKQDILVLEDDLYVLEELTGLKIDGILGANIFKHLVVQIDYKKQRITLRDPEFFKAPSGYEVLDLELHKNKPYLSCKASMQLGEFTNVKLLLDTGASIHFLLHTNSNQEIHLPQVFTLGNIGHGLGGSIEGYLGMINQINIGQTAFKQVVISFQELDSTIVSSENFIRNGIIGNRLLERFHVMIDYFNGKLYLKPRPRVSKRFRYDKSGLVIYALGAEHNQFFVKDVIPGSPADKAGLKPGDVIASFRGVSAKYIDISRIIHVLSGRTGKRIRMKVLRDDKLVNIHFRLEDFLSEALNQEN